MNLVVDISSGLTWVPSDAFESSSSDSYLDFSQVETFKYDDGKIIGHLVNDLITTQCTNDRLLQAYINFVVVNQTQNLHFKPNEGLIGLSPENPLSTQATEEIFLRFD